MVLICGPNLPAEGTSLDDMKIQPFNKLTKQEQDSVTMIVAGHSRALDKKLVQNLLFEPVVFKRNGN
jgi:hypothetical protein